MCLLFRYYSRTHKLLSFFPSSFHNFAHIRELFSLPLSFFFCYPISALRIFYDVPAALTFGISSKYYFLSVFKLTNIYTQLSLYPTLRVVSSTHSTLKANKKTYRKKTFLRHLSRHLARHFVLGIYI